MGPDSLTIEERLLFGHDDDIVFRTEEEKAKTLEILSRTELGRRRAEEFFGPDVWGPNRSGAFNGGSGLDRNKNEDDKDVDDSMFKELINGEDDDDDTKKERDNERNRVVTADSLEAERNAMDMTDSD